MVFTLRLRPIQGYDFEKIRRVLTEAGLCAYDPDLQPQSVSVRFDEATYQFTRRGVRVDVRDGDPASIVRFVYVVACAGSWAASASDVSPSFEVTKYDFRGTQNRPTVNAVFNAFVGGDVFEAARLWGREKGRMLRAGLAVRDLEARIRDEGPEAALLELESFDQ